MKLRRLLCRLVGHKALREVWVEGTYTETRVICQRCHHLLWRSAVIGKTWPSPCIGERDKRWCAWCGKKQWHVFLGPTAGWVCLGYPWPRKHNIGKGVR